MRQSLKIEIRMIEFLYQKGATLSRMKHVSSTHRFLSWINDCAGRTGYGASETEAGSLFASASLSSGGPSSVFTRNSRFPI